MKFAFSVFALASLILIAFPQTSVLHRTEVISNIIGFGSANAQPARRSARRTVRRTARRTTRRVNYRRSVAGCPLRRGYYYCGGVYYRAVVQDGATVYVVVYP